MKNLNIQIFQTLVYICLKKVLKLIKKNELMNMDKLINIAKSKKLKIGVFPINTDNWIDVGEWDKYKQQANKKTFMTNNNTYISKNVIEKGASVSKNFLNELEIESIKQLLKNFKKKKR